MLLQSTGPGHDSFMQARIFASWSGGNSFRAAAMSSGDLPSIKPSWWLQPLWKILSNSNTARFATSMKSRGCFWGGNWKWKKQPLAATCQKRPGSGPSRPLAKSGHSRPLDQLAASGCQWLRVAASACKWLRAAASGGAWLQAWLRSKEATGTCHQT